MLSHATNALLRLARRSRRGPINPSFALSLDEARAELATMTPRPLARPVVVLGGFLDVGIGPRGFARRLNRVVAGDVPWLTFAHCVSFAQTRRRVVRAIDRRFGPGVDADQTIEVDVVGQSMGGLLALLAAQDDGTRRLAIRRLFTISSPLCGARLARLVPFNVASLHRDMRPGSSCVTSLASMPPTCELVSYVRLGDAIVGPEHASLPGGTLHWLDNPWPENAHAGALTDLRIVLDIARRLRGDAPVAQSPPAPLPN